MRPAGGLLVVLGLLAGVQGEVRARDPEVEEDLELRELNQDQGQEQGLGPGGRPTVPSSGGGGNYPARSGNWCAFVQATKATTAVKCGTEKYTITSYSPCPSAVAGCQLVMYKLATRPVYQEVQKITTALLWHCCPGYTGRNCEQTAQLQMREENEELNDTLTNDHAPSDHAPSGHHDHAHNDHAPSDHAPSGHHDHAHNDHAPSGHAPHDDTPFGHTPHYHHDNTPQVHKPSGHALHDHIPSGHALHDHNTSGHALHDHIPSGHALHDHTSSGHAQHNHTQDPVNMSAPLDDHHHENHSMDGSASAAVPSCPHMMALIMSQLQPILQSFNRSLEQLGQKVLLQEVAQTRMKEEEEHRHPEEHHVQMEQRLQAMLLHNLTRIKTETEVLLQQNQKHLQAMTSSLAQQGLGLDQLRAQLAEQAPGTPPPQHVDPRSVWEAIERLDDKVVNTSIKVSGLLEDMGSTTADIVELRRDFRQLDEQLAQTGRRSQILFMETGLEVEAAKVTVLNQVSQLAGNLSAQSQRLQEMDVDVDYLYTATSDCKALQNDIAHLERGVANATELANENRLAMAGMHEPEGRRWSDDEDWEAAVESVQHELQQVKESLALQKGSTQALHHNLTQLSSRLLGNQEGMAGLQEGHQELANQMRLLASTFRSLLEDTLRHSAALELLLGEEVLDFLERPAAQQQAYAIPHLQEQQRHLEEVLGGTTSGNKEEMPMADQPSYQTDWSSEAGGTPLGGVEAELQAEVLWLRRGLQQHLKVFKDVFSNTEWLHQAGHSLDLHKVWLLVEQRGRRVSRRGAKEEGRTEKRSKRDLSGTLPALGQWADMSLLLVATTTHGPPGNGPIQLEAQVNRGQVLSHNVFTAPIRGTYMFLLTLQPDSGHAHILLRGRGLAPLDFFRPGAGGAGLVQLALEEGDSFFLELEAGELRSSQNVFAALLLHQHT